MRTANEEQLWVNVLRDCEAEFYSTFGVPWNPRLTSLGRPDHSLEREARDIHSRLLFAIKEAVGFVQKKDTVHNRWGNPAVIALLSNIPDRIAPLLREGWLTRAKWPPLLAHRAQLVTILDSYDLFRIPKLPNGSSRFFNAREMALVSLLAGNRPKLTNGPLAYTPAEVIKLEVSYMRPLLKKHGENFLTDEDRGPLAGQRKQEVADEPTVEMLYGDELAAPWGRGES